jgi:two-component system NtrC family response regulator
MTEQKSGPVDSHEGSEARDLPTLLIVEDDVAALRQLRWTFDDYHVVTATDRGQALEQLRSAAPAVVLLDLGLPPDAEGASEGLATLGEILAIDPATRVIVVTGREEREHALRAVELGAYDFYQKPIQAEELRFLVERARRLHDLDAERRQAQRDDEHRPLPGIIATSDSMLRVCGLVKRAAASDISVFLIGESGTGKEVLTKALHLSSARSDSPLVVINCAAIPEQLLESELFGHERGAFTGAVRRSRGQVEFAQGGTLFLDEVGDMPLPLQAKVLRFLQERVIQRVGGREDIEVDVRIVSATHQDLQRQVAEGSFREDLYYRINELTIEIPPLRSRPEDAVLLARHFFDRFHREAGLPLRGLSSDAIAAVARYDWPGNVRELENCMKRAVLLAEGPLVTARDLNLEAEGSDSTDPATLKDAVHEVERRELARAWAESGENVSRASKILGVSRPTVYKLLRAYGIKD